MTHKDIFFKQAPNAFFLEIEEQAALEDYLLEKGWLSKSERITALERPGEGNMNCVLRVKTNQRSFIIKQSRPWVEKFPQIAAPAERAIIEGQFYQLIQLDDELIKFTPRILGTDEQSSIIVLEDLDDSGDFTFIYQHDKTIAAKHLQNLVKALSTLHQNYNVHTTHTRIPNRQMRNLNHEHLFVFPFKEANGFDLDTVQTGLQQLAKPYKTDEAFKDKVGELGDLYLEDGDYLLHGDYYPGSWLNTANGVKVIDPEFCFFGPAEFDLAVLIAHLKMAQQPEAYVQQVLQWYVGKELVDIALLTQFVGVEIMRRLIGIAQLPLSLSLSEKEALLEEAYLFIVQPEASPLISASTMAMK